MAMVLATWCDPTVTPKSECAWALRNGYKCLGSGTYYSYFVPAARRYGLKCTMLNGASIYGNSKSPYHAQAKAAVDRGDLVIACMGKGNWTRSGHYVLVWQISGDTIYINDPASTKTSRTRGSYSLFKSQVKYYWTIKRPEPQEIDADYYVKVTDRAGLNCRKGPGTAYEVMAVYPYEAAVHISRVTTTGWGRTEKGWINLTNTKVTEKEDELEMSIDEMLAQMTGAQAYELVSKALAYAGDKPEPRWSRKEGYWAKAVKDGVVNGGAPERSIKRDEVVAIMGRLGLLGDPLPEPTEPEEA